MTHKCLKIWKLFSCCVLFFLYDEGKLQVLCFCFLIFFAWFLPPLSARIIKYIMFPLAKLLSVQRLPQREAQHTKARSTQLQLHTKEDCRSHWLLHLCSPTFTQCQALCKAQYQSLSLQTTDICISVLYLHGYKYIKHVYRIYVLKTQSLLLLLLQ